MGRIRTHGIKKASFDLINAYPDKFTNDFGDNKKILSELNIAQEKRLRNKISGYITRVVKCRRRDTNGRSSSVSE